jgi:hypothetical protein
MPKQNWFRKLSILFIALVAAGAALYYWGYPQYHLTRINEEILPRNRSEPLEFWLSPTGTWRIKIADNYEPSNPEKSVETIIQFSSIDLPFKSYAFSVPDTKLYTLWGDFPTEYQLWSPNGKSLILGKPNGVKCNDQGIVLFNEVGGKWEGPYYYNPVTDKSHCYGFIWSEDSTQLAIYTIYPDSSASKTILVTILNTKGEIQKEFAISSPASDYRELWDLYWHEDIFLLIKFQTLPANESDSLKPQSKTTLIYYFAIDKPEKLIHVMDLEGYHDLLGWDPTSRKMVLASESDSGCELKLIEIATKRVEQGGVLDPDCRSHLRLGENSNEYFAYSNWNPNSGQMEVKLWDWKSKNIVDKGTYVKVRVLPWQDSLRGFLILVEDNDGKKYFDVLRP